MSSPHAEFESAVLELARHIFGERLDVAQAYADILVNRAVAWGLIGPGEAGVIWERHLLNCGLLESLIPPDSSVGDIGSGAGLPGLVLAIARPDLEVTCLEPLLRRAGFLTSVVDELELTNARIVRARAEDARDSFDVVTARAVAPLTRLLPMAAPLIRAGGSLLALKGERAEAELGATRRSFREWGISDGEVVVLAKNGVSAHVVHLHKAPAHKASSRSSRRSGQGRNG